MIFVITGVETNNKGAELMLYAILQEIERKYPEATVYLQPKSIPQGLNYVRTLVKLRYWPFSVIIEKIHINDLLERVHLPKIQDTCAKKADFFFDGSGFRFSDQCKLWGTTPKWWRKLLKSQSRNGSKIVFLPQAFGPIEMKITKQAISAVGEYASFIMPRESVSYNYLNSSGLVDMKKVAVFPDFTSLVDGVFPKQYNHLKDGICIIPNMKMIEKGKVSYDNYIRLLSDIIGEGKKCGHPVYLLNHEGKADENLALKCRDEFDGELEVVTGINALEVKGLIATAYVVITSRFHGLASALNSCVPSLATSWSHKYGELFKDYALDNYVLPLNNNEVAISKVNEILDEKENHRIRCILFGKVPLIKNKTREMWNLIWQL